MEWATPPHNSYERLGASQFEESRAISQDISIQLHILTINVEVNENKA